MDANSHPIKVTEVGPQPFYANSHPYKVTVVGGESSESIKDIEDFPTGTFNTKIFYHLTKTVTHDSQVYEPGIYYYDVNSRQWTKLGGGSGGEDDILVYPTRNDFPTTGAVGKLYVAADTGIIYKWNLSAYEELGASVWEKGAGENSVQQKGTGSVAEGDYSVAEGIETIARSDYSHAEGWASRTIVDTTDPETNGHASHAEGSHTIAKGAASHAEGNSTESNGMYSHAEGAGSLAGGIASHAEGDGTVTNNHAEHAEGAYNKSTLSSSSEANDGTLHSVGIGTSMTDRKNAFEIMQNGDAYLMGVGDYDGTNTDEATTLQEAINKGNFEVKFIKITEEIGELTDEQFAILEENTLNYIEYQESQILRFSKSFNNKELVYSNEDFVMHIFLEDKHPYNVQKSGVLTNVFHDESLEGNGTQDSPLKIATTVDSLNLSRINDYLYTIEYKEENTDYQNAIHYFATNYRGPVNAKQESIKLGACSAVAQNGYFGRNYDWYYSNAVSFVVRYEGGFNTYSYLGTTGGLNSLDKNTVASRQWNKMYEILPFFVLDGVNEHGVCVTVNVVTTENGETTGTNQGATGDDLCMLQLPSYVLMNFKTAAEAANYISRFARIYSPLVNGARQEMHFMISDENESYVIEFIRNEVIVLRDQNIITNFFLTGVEFDSEGLPDRKTITPYGQGVERYNLIAENLENTMGGLRLDNLMKQLYYTKSYTGANPRWNTEFTGPWADQGYPYPNLTVTSPESDFDGIIEVAKQRHADRERDPSSEHFGTWQTVNSCIYDMRNKTLALNVQESDYEETKTFKLFNTAGNGRIALTQGKEVLGWFSVAQDTDQIINIPEGGSSESIQVEEMPPVIPENNGKIVQYVGKTDDYYTNGYFYKCVATGAEPTATIEQTVGTGIQDLAVDAQIFDEMIGETGDYEVIATTRNSIVVALDIEESPLEVLLYRYPAADQNDMYAWEMMGEVLFTENELPNIDDPLYIKPSTSAPQVGLMKSLAIDDICWEYEGFGVDYRMLGVSYTPTDLKADVLKSSEELGKVTVSPQKFFDMLQQDGEYLFTCELIEGVKPVWSINDKQIGDIQQFGISYENDPKTGSFVAVRLTSPTPKSGDHIVVHFTAGEGENGWWQHDTQPTSGGDVTSVNGYRGDVWLSAEQLDFAALAYTNMPSPYGWYENKVVQYVGDDYYIYKKGHFYNCEAVSGQDVIDIYPTVGKNITNLKVDINAYKAYMGDSDNHFIFVLEKDDGVCPVYINELGINTKLLRDESKDYKEPVPAYGWVLGRNTFYSYNSQPSLNEEFFYDPDLKNVAGYFTSDKGITKEHCWFVQGLFIDLDILGITFDGEPEINDAFAVEFRNEKVYEWKEVELGGDGAVQSVNGKVGEVELYAEDIPHSAIALNYIPSVDDYPDDTVFQYIGESYSVYDTGRFYKKTYEEQPDVFNFYQISGPELDKLEIDKKAFVAYCEGNSGLYTFRLVDAEEIADATVQRWGNCTVMREHKYDQENVYAWSINGEVYYSRPVAEGSDPNLYTTPEMLEAVGTLISGITKDSVWRNGYGEYVDIKTIGALIDGKLVMNQTAFEVNYYNPSDYVWKEIDFSGAVRSVNGYTGDVVLNAGDIEYAAVAMDTLVEPSEYTVGMVVKYIGENESVYKAGHTYRCIEEEKSISIEQTVGTSLSNLSVRMEEFGKAIRDKSGIHAFMAMNRYTLQATIDSPTLGTRTLVRFGDIDDPEKGYYGWVDIQDHDLQFLAKNLYPGANEELFNAKDYTHAGFTDRATESHIAWYRNTLVEDINKEYGITYEGIPVEGDVIEVNYYNGKRWLDLNASDEQLDKTSTNCVQNKVVTEAIKEVNDRIDNISGRGRFLALWDCVTGMPKTNPLEIPYEYKAGDYYIVERVATITTDNNYRPAPGAYDGKASTILETQAISVNDEYFYDGAEWKILGGSQKDVSFSSIAGEPEDNENLAEALDAKANKSNTVTTDTEQTISGKKTFTNDYFTVNAGAEDGKGFKISGGYSYLDSLSQGLKIWSGPDLSMKSSNRIDIRAEAGVSLTSATSSINIKSMGKLFHNDKEIATQEYVDNKVKAVDVVLSKDDWEDMQQTVSVEGVTADSIITWGANKDVTANIMNVMVAAGVICSAQDEGTLTFKCLGDDYPGIDLPIIVTVTN